MLIYLIPLIWILIIIGIYLFLPKYWDIALPFCVLLLIITEFLFGLDFIKAISNYPPTIHICDNNWLNEIATTGNTTYINLNIQ